MKQITEEQTAEAIKRLELNKERCTRLSFFGDDNHERIEVMIDVIKNNRSEDYIYRTYPSDDEEDGSEDFYSHGLWESAMSAKGFLRGETKLDDLLFPEP